MKKLWAILMAVAMVASVSLLATAPVAAASPATFGDDPSDWEKTANRIVEDTSTGLGTATEWTDAAWGSWVTLAWDGPANGIYGDPISYWVANDTWTQWGHEGTNWTQHSDQWFRTTVDIPGNWSVTSVELLYKYNEAIIPINDDLYVHVDDEYVAAGGTAGVGWVQTLVGATPPDPTPYGTFVATVDPYSFAVAPETGWYLDGGLDLPPELFTPGSHDIHVLGEEFDAGGGLGHLVIEVEYEEVTIASLTPTEVYNLVGTEHCVTATVAPAVAGIDVSFEVTGANPTGDPPDPTITTNGIGQATFCYDGDTAGMDTIRAYIDTNLNGSYDEGEPTATVTKYWFCNFLTGGANIKNGKKITWNMTGNVFNLPDGTIKGNFHIKDFVTGKQYKCHNDFDSLVFSGPDATSPPASNNKAIFKGDFTGPDGLVTLTIEITDIDESGRIADTFKITAGNTIGFPNGSGAISNGNFQVHEGCK